MANQTSDYPTWAIGLWIDNDECSQETALEIAREQWEEADGDRDTAVYRTADRLKDWHDEMVDMQDMHTGPLSDLLSWALQQVDWHELASGYVDMVRSGDY